VFNYLACGKPVLSSRTISLVRLLGDNLFYYDDKDGFVRETKRILEAPDNEKKNTGKIAKEYDWEVLARKYEDILRRAILRILLLANQPEHTTRLKMFQNTLEELG